MGLERRIKGRPCPRNCGGTMLTGGQTRFNAVSVKDGKQICPNCFLRETVEAFLEGEN